MNSHSLSLIDITKNRLIAWTLLLAMLASGVAAERESLGASLAPAVRVAQQVADQSRMAIRYSIWLYRLYRVTSERQVSPGAIHAS